MSTALEILARVAGGLLIVGTLWSAMLTVVVPRAERPRITRYHFKLMGLISKAAHRSIESEERLDRFDARLAPFGLVTLAAIWVLHLVVGFALIFWGQGVGGFIDALVLSGSSITTLGTRDADSATTLILIVVEALLGLGLVGLIISYLPTIYGAYLEREVAVARLEVRAGRPAHPLTFLHRSNRIGWIDEMDPVWGEWEDWFLHIEETHSTHTSLSFFRSARHGRSWLHAAGVVLDAASLMLSTVDVDQAPRGALCIRSGFVCLNSLADMFEIERPINPQPDDPITMSRAAFDDLCAEFERLGVPLKDDLDQAWLDFKGWRVNYEASLLGLLDYLRIAPGEWFGSGVAVPSKDASRAVS